MTKIYTKLLAIALAIIVALTLVATSTYAWFVLSSSPAVEGIAIAIGGGNTILIAADTTEVVDGETYHYPSYFSDTLNFGQHPNYRWLTELGGLTPVSTADGIHWYLPTYYQSTDEEVLAGQVPSGQLKDVSDFEEDVFLDHANLSATQVEELAAGSYIYIDFWVVSPSEDYTLRVSTGDDSSGSFLLDLPEPVAGEDGTSYTLSADTAGAAACVRVGFLASSDYCSQEFWSRYEASAAYDERYTQLKGVYQEQDGTKTYSDNNRFTIYEPNGDLHPWDEALNGSYVFTRPVGYDQGLVTTADISDRLTVQLSSAWSPAGESGETQLEQRFQAALLTMEKPEEMTLDELSDAFYRDYLQGQISPYVSKGNFLRRTGDLYAHSAVVTPQQLAELEQGGATEDTAIIQLEKNVPQRIRMFLWLEGQDVDCVNGINASAFTLNIELAGSSES